MRDAGTRLLRCWNYILVRPTHDKRKLQQIRVFTGLPQLEGCRLDEAGLASMLHGKHASLPSWATLAYASGTLFQDWG